MRRFGNPNGQAWFYSVPPKQEISDPVGHPPFSQIPCLNPMRPQPEEISTKGWIKSTDSQYVQLAKQGGRPDLLCPQTKFTPSEQAVGYPICPWYYDDPKGNQSNQNNRGEHKFSVPVYMSDPSSRSDPPNTSNLQQKTVSFK